MPKKPKMKYYVVWNGRKPGIYTSWEECEKQVKGYKNAKYKAFESYQLAKKALEQGPQTFETSKKSTLNKQFYLKDFEPELRGIAVDAACSGNPGPMEYRGVWLENGQEVFHQGPFMDATNNIGEFLAIVHALALLKQKNLNLPVYSDSQIAINWVKNKKCNTSLKPTEKNKKVFELIHRAEKWLQENSYQNPVLKWNTREWGEIPADFGRK